jgi:hypothetical protein
MTSTRTANKDALWYISNRTYFKGSNLYGIVQPPLDFYEPAIGRLPHNWINELKGSDYIVYSYGTPIAWFKNGEWLVPNLKYSQTTSRHQSLVRRAINA